MNRVITMARWDIQIQWRAGFYVAAGVVLLVWFILIGAVPPGGLVAALPTLLLSNMLLGTFYFTAGLMLLERAEGSLVALIVTPLHAGEYIVARCLTLGLLSTIEGLVVILLSGTAFAVLPLLLGLVIGASLLTMAGTMLVARYREFNSFLMPSMLWSTLLILPAITGLAHWDHPLIWLHPLQPVMVLLRGALQPLVWWEWLYALLGSLVVVVGAWYGSQHAVERIGREV